MIRKSGNRFSEKIMLKQRDEIMIRFNLIERLELSRCAREQDSHSESAARHQ
jgi:hypothetical protein